MVDSVGAGSVPPLPPPRPKSPPPYPDLYGKRRELARVQILEREISYLEEELKSVEGLRPASRSCKELTDFVTGKSDPLIPVTKKVRRSRRFWKWLWNASDNPCGMSCFNISWICCYCPKCPRLRMPHCCDCNCSCSCKCCNLDRCFTCSMPKCNCSSSCLNTQCCDIPDCSCCKRCCCVPKCSWSCSVCFCFSRRCNCPKCPKCTCTCNCPKCPKGSCCCPPCDKKCCCYPCYLCC